MTDSEREEMRSLIAARLAEAETAAAANRDATDTVALDQQSVGRLARMDAIERQQIARATAARRQAEVTRLRAAQARVDTEMFGYCAGCGDEIAIERLRIEPTLLRCADCMRDA